MPADPLVPAEPLAAGRVRPPLPPLRPVPVAPRTTMAPFHPAPGHPDPEPAPPGASHRAEGFRAEGFRAEDFLASSAPAAPRPSAPPAAPSPAAPPTAAVPAAPAAGRGPASSPARGAGGFPAEDRPAAPFADERPAPRTAGPAFGGRVPGGTAFGAGPAGSGPWTGPGATAGPAYGDWTRPSRSGSAQEEAPAGAPARERHAVAERHGAEPAMTEQDAAERARAEREAAELRAAAERFPRLHASAPTETTAIPERDVVRRDRAERGPSTGPGLDAVATTGTIGGRAAQRDQRRAAEEARIRARKESAAAARLGGRRSPRRAAVGLVAVAIVALIVLGVYSFTSPHARVVAAQQPAVAGTSAPSVAATAPVPGVGDLPTLDAGPLSAAPTTTAAASIRLPVTVLNATTVQGLAAKVAGALKAAGWPTASVGTYLKRDVAASTVYFTQGDENQRQAAVQLVGQFPQLQGPVPRFFDVPGQAAPGLVVVTTGDWKP